VFKTPPDLIDEHLVTLYEAVASYGPQIMLFHVRFRDEAQSGGTATVLKPCLPMGSYRFSTSEISTDGCVKLCNAAKALFDDPARESVDAGSAMAAERR